MIITIEECRTLRGRSLTELELSAIMMLPSATFVPIMLDKHIPCLHYMYNTVNHCQENF